MDLFDFVLLPVVIIALAWLVVDRRRLCWRRRRCCFVWYMLCSCVVSLLVYMLQAYAEFLTDSVLDWTQSGVAAGA